MAAESVRHVTQLRRAAQAGDATAAERLLAVVNEQLHQLARARMAHLPPGQTCSRRPWSTRRTCA